MAKGSVYISKYPDNPPDWYWTSGLHDACIIGIDNFEFLFDYNKFVEEKNKYNRNLFSFKIDASGAIYDNRVKEIRLFNYKIISDNIDLHRRKKIWWLADRLTQTDGHFVLEIDMQDFDSRPKEFTFKIKFERAEVDRI